MTYLNPALPLFLLLLAVGIAIRAGKFRKTLLVSGVLGLFLWSWAPVAWLFLRSLEGRYPAQPPMEQVAEAIVVFTPLDPSSELDRMERKIRSQEAHAMATLQMGEDSYDSQFQALDAETDVEDELAALKSSMGMNSSPSLPAGGQSGS